MLYAASGDPPPEAQWNPASGEFPLGSAPAALPAWIEPAHLDHLATTFARTGFSGGLAWYRNMDRTWELTAAFEGRKIEPPALFLIGDADAGYAGLVPQLAAMASFVRDLRGTIVIPGAGHWLGEERPGEVNEALLGFLGAVAGAPSR
jgi:pimeloyl-ACP methyl ester carboxylesterase